MLQASRSLLMSGLLSAPALWIILNLPCLIVSAQDSPPGRRSSAAKATSGSASAFPRLGRTWIRLKGTVYGAQPDADGPIGGGPGYRRILTGGDFRVSTTEELRAALSRARPGQVVYIAPEAQIDCTGLVLAEKMVLELPGGVTLAGNRGIGSPGPVIYSDAFATQPLIRVLGPDARITGLRIVGPDPKDRADHHRRAFDPARGDVAERYAYYGKFPVSDGIITFSDRLEVDNCEITGWSHSGVFLAGGADHRIHHNYLHHNQFEGFGYAVCLGAGGKLTAVVDHNVFDHNRCAVAGTGAPGNAYEACHNVVMEHIRATAFDMHGGRARNDGTDIAGDWIKIHHNRIRFASPPAVILTGAPREPSAVTGNWFHAARPADAVLQVWGEGNLNCHDNAYGAARPVVIAR